MNGMLNELQELYPKITPDDYPSTKEYLEAKGREENSVIDYIKENYCISNEEDILGIIANIITKIHK